MTTNNPDQTVLSIFFGDYTPDQISEMVIELGNILQQNNINYNIIDNDNSSVSSTSAVVSNQSFEVDIFDTEVAEGPNIIQWKIIKDEFTTKRMAAIKDIIQNTIDSNS
jgi:hypothetical protein